MQGFFANHRPIGLCIIKYLAPIDYIALSRSFAAIRRQTPVVYPSTVDFLFEHIEQALKKRLGDAIAEVIICNLITERNNLSWFDKTPKSSFLSGGFLLAILNGDAILPEQDIDILLSHMGNNPILEGLAPLMTDVEENGDSYRQDILLNVVTGVILSKVPCKIQFIWKQSMKDNVANYDLMFCKNIANKHSFHMMNAYSVLKRICDFSVADYIVRYIVIDDYHYENTDYIRFYEKISGRIAKYRARGYEVRLVENLPEDIIQCLAYPRDVATKREREIARLWSLLR